jgi:hypothetical protein
VAFILLIAAVVAVYPFGPVHAYVAPVVVGILSVIVPPAQRVGVVLVIVGAATPVVVADACVLYAERLPAASLALTLTELLYYTLILLLI